MQSTIVRNSDDERIGVIDSSIIYRYALRKQSDNKVRQIIDFEMQRATMEILEEHVNTMRQLVEDYKSTIRRVVEEEKEEIWKKAEILKKSMLKLGL